MSSPIKAHQQGSVPLLRKPRPPKPLKVEPLETADSKNKTPMTPYSKTNTPRNPLTSVTGRPTPQSLPYTPFSEIYSHSRYTEDPYIEQEYLGEDERSGFIIHPTHPRGPCFFPPGKIFRAGHVPLNYYNTYFKQLTQEQTKNRDAFEEDEIDYPDDVMFTLNDFQLSVETSPHPVFRTSRSASGVMMSQQNYLKLTGWFATNVPTQENLNTVDLEVDHEAVGPRKPQHQVLIELCAMVKEMLASGTVVEMESAEPSSVTVEEGEQPRWPSPTPEDTLFRSSTTRYFCGEGRANTPFDSSNQPLISPSEVAILESMMAGGSHLSLKAHFISELPDLTPLTKTLTHLNLSFNNLRSFPLDILDLCELVWLKMRNNPIRELPNDIKNLSKLRVFCISFNLLSDLPTGLFQLSFLEDLDISYNTIHMLSRDIGKLKNLYRLNVEGNQLAGLPSTAVSLPLSHLLIGDNLMHPLLWKENTRNQPQTLVDLCCVSISRSDQDGLAAQVTSILQSHSHGKCDQCGGVVFGSGMRLIRAVSQEKFKIKNLPFIFTVCSPQCRTLLRHK